MGIKDIELSNKIKYSFNRKGGRCITHYQPIFSSDGQSLIVIVDNTVQVYNVGTGDCVSILETEQEVSKVIAVQFPINENHNLYGCSECGRITIWTWESGVVLKEKDLQIPQDFKVLTFDVLDSNECFITAQGSQRKTIYMATYSLKSGQVVYEYNWKNIQYYKIISVAIGWSKDQRFAAICNGTKSLYIQDLSQPHIRNVIVNYNGFRILSVVAHSSENYLAITDTLGRATILKGNLYKSNEIGREVLHWHSLPLITATFSFQGSYLFTGGVEKVVVKWSPSHLTNKANEKQFLPRLPGTIRFIACSNSHIAISLNNNSIVLATAQLRVTTTIMECGGLSSAVNSLGPGLVFHRPLGALLLGGRTGHLQVFSTTSDNVLYNVDITGMNNIPATRENLLPIETEVMCAAVSADGSWLVTSEYRNDAVMYPEERLKFWALVTNSSSPFTLNTCVNLSHFGCKVISLALDKTGNMCVSAGTDQKFRIWSKVTVSQEHRKKVSWNCHTACYYSSGFGCSIVNTLQSNFKNTDTQATDNTSYYYLKEVGKKYDVLEKLVNNNESLYSNEKLSSEENSLSEMGGVAISQDGSLIAAWFGSKLSLWDTELCIFRTILSHPSLRPKGVDVKFGNDDAAHYLVCTTAQCLAVWSVLSLTIRWLVYVNPVTLIADPFSNRMAIVTTDNDLFVFSPHSSTPIISRKALLNPNSGTLRHCAFGPAGGEEIKLYFLRNDSEIYCLEPERSEESKVDVIARTNIATSNFGALIAEQQLSTVKPPAAGNEVYIDSDGLRKTALHQFFGAASHMLPSVSLICTSFLEHISGRKDEQLDEEPIEEIELKDENSSDEETIQMKETQTSKVELWVPNYEDVKEKKLRKILKEPVLDSSSIMFLFGDQST